MTRNAIPWDGDQAAKAKDRAAEPHSSTNRKLTSAAGQNRYGLCSRPLHTAMAKCVERHTSRRV